MSAGVGWRCAWANTVIDKKYSFSVKWPVLEPSKIVFNKEELQNARQMIEEYQKIEEKKEGIEKKFLMSPNGMSSFFLLHVQQILIYS